VNTWKVIFATMVIFGAGVMTGGLVVRHAAIVQAPAPPHGPTANRTAPPGSLGGLKVEFLRRAGRDLNLTIGQKEEVDRIISASQERTRKIMEPVAPKIREELKQTKAQFRAILTPEQQEQFDQLLKQQQHGREQHRPPVRPVEDSSLPGAAAEPARQP
jgi:hypothetical protein